MAHEHGTGYVRVHDTLLPSSPSRLPLPLSPIPSKDPSPLFPKLTSDIASLELHPTLEATLHILNNDLPSAHFLVRHMQDVVPTGKANGTQRSQWSQAAASSDQSRTEADHAGGKAVNGANDEGTSAEQANDRQGHDQNSAEPPKLEGILLHAILHRVEGDYENAKAWYRDVDEAARSHTSGAASSGQPGQPRNAFEATWSDLDSAIRFVDGIQALRSGKLSITASSKAELEEQHRHELDSMFRWCETRYGKTRWEEASSEFTGMAQKHKDIAQKMTIGGEGWRSF